MNREYLDECLAGNGEKYVCVSVGWLRFELAFRLPELVRKI
jgi:hypothetical protein